MFPFLGQRTLATLARVPRVGIARPLVGSLACCIVGIVCNSNVGIPFLYGQRWRAPPTRSGADGLIWRIASQDAARA